MAGLPETRVELDILGPGEQLIVAADLCKELPPVAPRPDRIDVPLVLPAPESRPAEPEKTRMCKHNGPCHECGTAGKRPRMASHVPGPRCLGNGKAARKIVGRIGGVGVAPDDKIPVRRLNADIQGGSNAFPGVIDKVNICMRTLHILEDLPRSVPGHSVKGKYFNPLCRKILIDYRFKASGNANRLVTNREDDGDGRQGRHATGRSRQTIFAGHRAPGPAG